MSFESLGFAYHCDVDNKFTHALSWTQILLILCKRPNKVYLLKTLKQQAEKQVLGQKVCSMRSPFDFDTGLTSGISTFKADA